MKFLNLIGLMLALMIMNVGFLSAQQTENNRTQQDGANFNLDINERDFNALKEYISTKRNVDLKEKITNLKISGDIRTEWRHLTETGIRPLTLPGIGVFSQDLF